MSLADVLERWRRLPLAAPVCADQNTLEQLVGELLEQAPAHEPEVAARRADLEARRQKLRISRVTARQGGKLDGIGNLSLRELRQLRENLEQFHLHLREMGQ